MSKVKIQGNASGTGVVTLTAPNTNTDRTIALPDGTGTLVQADASGNVGIGTNPDTSSLLHLKRTTADCKLTIETDESHDAYINFSGATSEMSLGYEPTTNSFIIANASDGITSAERMRIDSAGRMTMPNQPAFRAYCSVNQYGQSYMEFVDDFDIGNNFNVDRFTAPIAGRYHFDFHDNFTGITNANLHIILRVNGVNKTYFYTWNHGGWEDCSGSIVLNLAEGDYVQLWLGSGTSMHGDASSNGQWGSFSGHLIG